MIIDIRRKFNLVRESIYVYRKGWNTLSGTIREIIWTIRFA